MLCVKHHPSEPLLVSGGKDRSIKFWDITSGEVRQQVPNNNGWVRALSFSADGSLLAVAADEPRVMLLERSREGVYEVSRMAFTDCARNLAVEFASADSRIVAAGNEGALIWCPNCDLAGKAIYESRGKPVQIVSPPNENAFVFASSQSISSVNLESGDVRETLVHNRNIAVDSNGNLVALIDYDTAFTATRVSVTDRNSAGKRVLFEGIGVAYGVDVSPSGSFVAAATPNRLLRVWQAPDFKQESLVRIPFDADFDLLLINNTGKQIFMQPTRSHEVIVMDVATSRRVAEIQNVEKVLNRSVDGRLLAIWQTDYSVAIYDTLHGLTVQRLAGHANEIVGACFLPCEQLVATISKAGEVVLWALDTGEQLVQFQANCRIKPVRKACLAFATDGRTLVAAGQITNDPMRWITELRTWQVP